MSYSDSDSSSSQAGEYKNFRQLTREREFSLSLSLYIFIWSTLFLTLVDSDWLVEFTMSISGSVELPFLLVVLIQFWTDSGLYSHENDLSVDSILIHLVTE